VNKKRKKRFFYIYGLQQITVDPLVVIFSVSCMCLTAHSVHHLLLTP